MHWIRRLLLHSGIAEKINKQFGITIVIITHQGCRLCVRSVRMWQSCMEGEVVEKGLVADIFANPQSEVAKELIRRIQAPISTQTVD